jgi:hypothetical protein
MRREDEQALWVFAGLWLVSRSVNTYSRRVVPAMKRAGARVYDWAHDDYAHEQDLPMHALSKRAVLAIAKNAGFPDPKLAAAIAYGESAGIPNALAQTSREYSVGLWQINLHAHPQYTREQMIDPIKNAAAAFQISHGGTNWRSWEVYTSGKYKLFLTGVLAP